MLAELRFLLRRLIEWATLPAKPGAMYHLPFRRLSVADFQGSVLLPELNDDEKKDLLPTRRLVVTKKADGSVVSDQTFPVAERTKVYSPVQLGDLLVVTLYDVDEANNQGTNPRVEEVIVTDQEAPTAQPGAMSHSFQPLVPVENPS